MIRLFLDDDNQPIKAFSLRLDNVVDPNVKQQLIKEWHDVKGMVKACNAFNDQYVGVLNPTDLKDRDQRGGNIVQKYNDYSVESRRLRIEHRVKELMDFLANHPDKFSNR